ncbi:MAG TPA: DUF4032 domain-containing protein [Pyrinomonadaceae bacterium]|nr:DUF4032 domain-containing protein [Pyrinomonadaceae bacterium]
MEMQNWFRKTARPRLEAEVRRTLSALAGVELSAREACEVLPRIESHKWYVSERLGRDVGLRVAALDYFENVDAARRERSAPGALARKLRRTFVGFAALHLTHLSRQAHEGVFADGPEQFTWPGE